MNRISSQLCNLESRMRREIAEDIFKKRKLEAEMRSKAAKRIKVDDDSGETFYTKDSLPPSMFHLGGDNYVSIVFFLSHTRVHIRRFVADEEDFLHASKNGVSLSLSVWHSFQKNSYNFGGQFLIIDKDLCVSREVKEAGHMYAFQRMFQRKNLSLQFLPESIVLTGAQMANMQDIFSDINIKVKECLLQQTLAHFVFYEHSQSDKELNDSNPDIYRDFHDFANLSHSLAKCLTKYVSKTIDEIFNCFACKENYPLSDLHACVTQSATEKFEEYFDIAFYKLDWRQLAKDFYAENVNDFLIVPIGEFFSFLNISNVMEDVKQMYIDN